MIDAHDLVGRIKSMPEKPEEVEEGQVGKLICEPTLVIQAAPEILDQFIDNLQAGTVPSAVFWSRGKNGEGDANAYVRWLDILGMEVQVDKERDFIVKCASIVNPQDPEAKKARIDAVLPVKLRKLWVEFGANRVTLELKVAGEQDANQHQVMRELFRREEIEIAVYQRQGDFVQPVSQRPRVTSDAGSGEGARETSSAPASTGKGKKGSKGKKAEKETVETFGESGELDPLFEEAVKEVVTSKKTSVSHVQLIFKIAYNRAALLVQAMEEHKLVSPLLPDGTREILVTAEQVADSDNDGTDAIPDGGNEPSSELE